VPITFYKRNRSDPQESQLFRLFKNFLTRKTHNLIHSDFAETGFKLFLIPNLIIKFFRIIGSYEDIEPSEHQKIAFLKEMRESKTPLSNSDSPHIFTPKGVVFRQKSHFRFNTQYAFPGAFVSTTKSSYKK
jgi:hypothetical protein